MAGDLDTDSPATKVEGAARPSTVFAVGDFVAQRYYIVRFLAEGGMGEVYEARDTVLAERVALKTIRAELAARTTTLARFMREVHVARQVTHPNVCRVFDVGEHGTTKFLTMQFLDGESLAAYLKRKKPLATDDARSIARQIAAAIDASHAAGIIHRDLKPANIILVPTSGGEPRVVVTDFGLARGHEDDDHHVSKTGDVAGTPAYMAPEQVEGSTVGPAADIYAFGIILFEMVTGSRPFKGDSTIATAVKRLKEDPPSPRSLTPDLDESWDRAILRCLERAPDRRFASAGEAVAALDTTSAATRTRRHWLIPAAAVLLAAGGGAVLFATRGGAAKAPAAASATRRSIAVLGFKNLARRDDVAWISTAASELLVTELGAGDRLRTLPGEDVARARVDLALPDSESFNAETLTRINRALHADLVVTGSYLLFGDRSELLRLGLRVQDAKSGETVATANEQGAASELPTLVDKAGAAVRDQLGLDQVTAAAAGQVHAALPANPEAARLYSEGLAKYRTPDTVGAQKLFEQAEQIAPEDPMIHAALADIWLRLGYDKRAREEGKLALDHAGSISPTERLMIEGRYHSAAHEQAAAIETFRKLADAAPDDLEIGLLFAHAQFEGNHPKEALETLTALRRLPDGDDPQVDLEASQAHMALGQPELSRDEAQRAVATARSAGDSSIATEALQAEALARLNLGDRDEAVLELDQVERELTRHHELGQLATVQYLRASELTDRGRVDDAERLARQAYSFYQDTGSVTGASDALMLLARIAETRGDLATAEPELKEAVALARGTEDSELVAVALMGLSDNERLSGHLSDARSHELEALGLPMADVYKSVVVQTLSQIALSSGDLTEAAQRAKDALTLGTTFVAAHGPAQEALGRVLFELGDFPGAQSAYEAGLAELGKANMSDAELCDVDLATIALGSGHPTEALEHTTRAVAALGAVPSSLGRALAIQVVAQLAAGKLADARATAAQIETIAPKLEPETRIFTQVATARLRAANNDVAGARALLAAAHDEANRLGLVLLQFECELAAGQIELQQGRAAEGKARLAKLAGQAKARGYARIAAAAQSSR